MPKRLPPNNRPWPENMAYDFALPPTITAGEAEAFIRSLPTSNRNKRFLLLRYQKGYTYNEIADEYGITPSGVRLAVKAMWEKFGRSTAAPVPTVPAPAVTDLAPQSAATPSIAPVTTPAAPAALQPISTSAAPSPPVANVVPPVKDESSATRPLSINLAAVRRFLGLTPEEFARPMHIDSGESLITRLETGFSKASQPVLDLICEAWGINRSYLLTGTGEMFEETNGYSDALVRLLRRYLAVATFDRQGQQFWKGSLVDDLGRMINTSKLDAPGMARVVRTLYDYLDVEEFEGMLERMGRG